MLRENDGITDLMIAHFMRVHFLFAISISFGLLASAVFAREGVIEQKLPAPSAHVRNLAVDDYFKIKDVEDAQISRAGNGSRTWLRRTTQKTIRIRSESGWSARRVARRSR